MSDIPMDDFVLEFKKLREELFPDKKGLPVVIGQWKRDLRDMSGAQLARCDTPTIAEYFAVCSDMVDVLIKENEVLNEELSRSISRPHICKQATRIRDELEICQQERDRLKEKLD